ncbi:MAG: hypothetical protein COU10_01395 [Candidatus Harrisonbacteria bacterium CG10_big_fil_rev_8_21_14_0_10_45_28]|uniref:Uncharacterized protein n=1 Tax=Candidatus Harrisonbacteria bacterium CG10_big_fil_rev_8_21_14_0_10_45_28 TaxID=1974586 RepID=A0A2H0UNM5_9BACT|nr:MAG: hypothetical protein COU10_01395 [Candidatus Harrisonbacteria bacterium CG10_big_fil_rev_8_21_14_0_10_45_28]
MPYRKYKQSTKKYYPRYERDKSEVKTTEITILNSRGKIISGRHAWISVAKGFVYISPIEPYNRAYYILPKCPEVKVSVRDEDRRLKIASYAVYFQRPIDYARTKKFLADFIKVPHGRAKRY